MKIVVVGKGGREHALARKLQNSSLTTQLWVCPGNPGMLRSGIDCATAESAADIERFCLENKVSLVVVGPESMILTDLKLRLEKQGIPTFAPEKGVATLESSKLYCKKVLREAQVATAKMEVVTDKDLALKALHAHDFSSPIVVKADGLAAGKGVWVCENLQQATAAVESLGSQFGFPLLLEECLIGQELSAFALCDGKDFVVLGTACDYKRIAPDMYSANTGGMGAYSPCDFITAEENAQISEIFRKTLDYLHTQGTPYQGFLFAGIMKTTKGLYVLEYNVRLGDPETQALLPRLKTDLAQLIQSAVKHELKNQICEVSDQVAVHVVAVSQGYPQSQMLLGSSINIAKPDSFKSELYYAGVSEKNNSLVNSGGRVLGVTAMAPHRKTARAQAYQDLHKISFEGMYFREDIGR